MWVSRYLFVGAVHFAVLAFIAAWAMGETIERHKTASVQMMPLKDLPVSVPALMTADEQLALAVEAFVKAHGRPLTYVALIQAAARVKHDDENVIERLSEWERREG